MRVLFSCASPRTLTGFPAYDEAYPGRWKLPKERRILSWQIKSIVRAAARAVIIIAMHRQIVRAGDLPAVAVAITMAALPAVIIMAAAAAPPVHPAMAAAIPATAAAMASAHCAA